MIKDIKYQGHTATPSDYECMDGELAGCYNLIPEDGALHPIMPPTIKFTLNAGEELLWLHQMTGHTHYIIMYTSTSGSTTTQSLKWVCEENGEGDQDPWTRHDITGSTITGTPTISSIGNTLIVNDDNGIQYFLWSTESSAHYEALGQKPPMLEITFGLHSDFAVWPDTKNIGNSNQSDYRGTIIEFGNLKEPVVPHLGDDDSSLTSWAKPKPVMEQGPEYQQKFAREYATYSIEGMDGGSDDEKSSIMTFKSMLSQSVFARLNSFVNEKGANDNKFVLPFFVRYGYRLYDGSYIRQSYPVLMIPNSRGPMFALDGVRGLCLNDNDDNYVETKIRGRIYGFLSELVYTISSIPASLTKWKDLITSIDIGVSAPIYTYDQAGEVLGWTNMDDADSWEPYYTISKVTIYDSDGEPIPQPWGGVKPLKTIFQSFDTATRNISGYGDYFNRYDTTYNYPNYIATIPLRKTADVNKSITSAANFHIIKEFSLDELATCSEAALELEDGVLGGLLGRKTMTDDYHSHDTLKASLMYNFNGRMNYASVERTPHSPLDPEIQFAQASELVATPSNPWQVEVSIKSEMHTLVVQSEQGSNNTNFPHWVFYPDANAKFAYIKHLGNTYELKLTPHDLLNGAYWLGDITKQNATPTAMTGTAPTPTSGAFLEQNKVYTSEINNPFYIPVTGINTVGTGKILGIRAAVKALSQGQFGQFPLYAFTTEGVWALEPSSTGSYIARQPVTRDVCTNPDSITQLDDSVLFATDKGIMLLSGSTTQCITDAISSEFPFDIAELPDSFASYLSDDGYNVNAMSLQPIASFLSGCRMIYDYNHQRIIVYNSNYNYAYVYSLKDHKWGMMVTNIDYGINSYPEALAVTDADVNNRRNVVNLSTEVLIDVNVKGLIITRPLKLDQPDALKTIDTIIQRGKFDFLKSGRTPKPIRSILFGSRDLYNWHLVSSSTDHYLRGFSGTPYKYFRLVALVDFLPDESIYGATIQYNPRYVNRPR